jgi:hypothetical protein
VDDIKLRQFLFSDISDHQGVAALSHALVSGLLMSPCNFMILQEERTRTIILLLLRLLLTKDAVKDTL